MAALKPVPGGVKIRFLMKVGNDLTTGYHMYFTTAGAPITQAVAQSVAGAAMGSFVANLVPLCHPTTAIEQTIVTDLSDPAGPLAEFVQTNAGTRAGGPLPANACALINMTIARRYRGGKPRAYFPGGTDTDLANPQQWTAGFQTALTNAWVQLIGDIGAALRPNYAGAFHCNISYYAGHQWLPDQHGNYHYVPTPRPVPVVDQITSNAVSLVLGSQRRRLRTG